MNRLSVCTFAFLIAGATALQLNYSRNGQEGPTDAAVLRRQALERGCYSQNREGASGKQAATLKELKWPNGIVPYEISKDYTSGELQLIKEGMNMISSQTCIKFVPRNSSHAHYVAVVPGEDCSSHVGMWVFKKHVLNLNKGGCMDPATVAHEFYHALGMSHEQQRADRDKYVQIMWDNIPEASKHDFELAKLSTSFGLPYDFGSLMHYLWNDMAIDKSKPTIVSKVPGKQAPRWYVDSLSPLDIKKMKKLYNCP